MRAESGPDDPDPVYDAETGHPFWVYMLGFTRFDLDAGGIGEYLDQSKNPETWSFRRMTIAERSRYEYLERTKTRTEANAYAFVTCVTGLDNPGTAEGQELARLLGMHKRPKNEKILQAVEDYAASALDEVGFAAYQASADLLPHEKKASAAVPGLTPSKLASA